MTHTELVRHTRNGPALRSAWPGGPAIRRPSAAAAVITVCAAVAFMLRAYQLARPGYLFGVTEYDDGALFGNALRLVDGVIAYRDFSMVQPPGSMLLMAPAAALAKVAGTAWGLAAARLLTVGADTANVILLGVLIRHRGPLAAGIACGLYAVYPDAIVAAHTFLLEPWLNLFCLAAAVAIFDRDRLVGAARAPGPQAARAAVAGPEAPRPEAPQAGPPQAGPPQAGPPRAQPPRAPRLSDTARLLLGGLLFGFAAAVKIWALVPLCVAVLLLLIVARRARPAAVLTGGAAIGLGVPLLPFAVLAPDALLRGVLVGQLARDVHGARHLLQRAADLSGMGLHPVGSLRKLLLAAAAAALVGCCLAAYRRFGRASGGRRGSALDGYALLCTAAVTAMLLWPQLYYTHYGAFDGAFIALAVALPIGLLAAARPARLRLAVAAVTVLAIAAAGYHQAQAESRTWGTQVAAAADRLIPPGACVVSNDPADTVSADRFSSDVAGCPQIVDSFGAWLALTDGRFGSAPPSASQSVVLLWQTAFEHAQYAWLTKDTGAQIPWNRPLFDYFEARYRLIGLSPPAAPQPYVPIPGIYART